MDYGPGMVGRIFFRDHIRNRTFFRAHRIAVNSHFCICIAIVLARSYFFTFLVVVSPLMHQNRVENAKIQKMQRCKTIQKMQECGRCKNAKNAKMRIMQKCKNRIQIRIALHYCTKKKQTTKAKKRAKTYFLTFLHRTVLISQYHPCYGNEVEIDSIAIYGEFLA
jgi:hypothetical protein